MLTAQGNISKGVAIDLIEKNKRKTVVGYDFNFAKWENRYYKEQAEGKIVNIDNEIAINKQSIQSVENSIYDKALGDLVDTDKDIREFSCDCGALYGKFYEGNVCRECGTKVTSKFSMDIKRVGWINIEPFCIINPNAYEIIGKVIGAKNLSKILQYDIQIDLEGKLSSELQNNNSINNIFDSFKNFSNINYGIFKHFSDVYNSLRNSKIGNYIFILILTNLFRNTKK